MIDVTYIDHMGNDETVVGVIDTISVDDEHDTYKKLKKMYENPSN